MSFSKKIVPLLVAGAVALGLAAVPAASATAAAPKTGTLHVQLVSPTGKVIHKANVSVGWGTSATGDGKLTGKTGAATFTVPVYSKYIVTANSKDQYFGSRRSGIKVLKRKTTQVRVVYSLGATISGAISKTPAVVAPAKQSTKSVVATTPFAGVSVQAYDATGQFAGHATTSSTGKYTLTGLATGSYRVQFNYRASASSIGGYPSPFYGGATIDTATPIAVTQQSTKKAGTAVTSINATLKQYNAISGTANFSDTDNAGIIFLDAETMNFVDSTGFTNGTSYSVRLPAGAYKAFVIASDPDSGTSYPFFYNAVDGDGVNLTQVDPASNGDENNALLAASTTITLPVDSDVTVNFVWGGFTPTSTPSDSPSPDPTIFVSPTKGAKTFTKSALPDWLKK